VPEPLASSAPKRAAALTPALPAALPAPQAAKAPRLVIVLDDWGYNLEAYPYLKEIRRPLTLSVLPGLPYTDRIAREGAQLGHEIILHMPMEAKRNVPREKLILVSGMASGDAEAVLDRALATLPNAKGVSNHEGSKATEDPALMRTVLAHLKKRGLFFLDSLTTQASAVAGAASDLSMRYVKRDVFLDNERTEAAIQARFDELKAIAKKRGVAVGIGHDVAVTMRVIEKNLPELEKEGIRIVPLSELYS
jgi:polysaccharide deacetylase 2 family uncharacterized protein YibQ